MPPQFQSEASQSVSTTLLKGAKEQDTVAWNRLDTLFRPIVFRWFTRRWRLDEDSAHDLVQNVFSKVLSGIKRFEKDRDGATFTGWLWTIARNEAMNYFDRAARQAAAIGGTEHQLHVADIPDQPPSDDPDEQTLKLQRLLEVVRGEVKQSTYAVFERLVIDGRDSTEVAEELGMKKSAVREAKRRVLKRLRDEWQELFGEWPFDDLTAADR